MKTHYLLILVILFSACAEENQEPINKQIQSPISKQIVNEEFQNLFDAVNLNGAILIYNLQKNIYYSNDFKWCGEGKLPASTFKIPNSIIALELGIVKNDSTVLKWDGEKRWNKNWNQDLILRDAFHFSCVPCYRKIARQIGVERMNKHLAKLDYGNITTDSSNIDMFWLEGNAMINQFEQIDFLTRFYEAELPIAEKTYITMSKLMVIEESLNYKISGKTGWAKHNGQDNCWFVGYVETNNEVYFFATNIEPKGQVDLNTFARQRKELTDIAISLIVNKNDSLNKLPQIQKKRVDSLKTHYYKGTDIR